MRFVRPLVFLIIILTTISPVLANTELPQAGILNPDFGSHLGTVTIRGDLGEAGVFVYDPAGTKVISMPLDDIREASFEYLGGHLSVYDDSGQALFELPDGHNQMQLTTSNGIINLSYRGQSNGVQRANMLTMDRNVLLQDSDDGTFRLYLLTTGELSVVMGPDAENRTYVLTFTSVPALNVKQEIRAG